MVMTGPNSAELVRRFLEVLRFTPPPFFLSEQANK